MSNPFQTDSPAYYRERIDYIRQFREAYIPYLNRTLPVIGSGGSIQYDAERAHLTKLATLANHAVALSGVRVAVLAPPMFGPRPPQAGLASVAFAHEDPIYSNLGDDSKASYHWALEALDSAEQILEQRLRAAEHRRRRPTFWIDRALRAVLGFPAYLLSLLFGFDRQTLSADRAKVLWVISVIADIGTLWGVGHVLNWWP